MFAAWWSDHLLAPIPGLRCCLPNRRYRRAISTAPTALANEQERAVRCDACDDCRRRNRRRTATSTALFWIPHSRSAAPCMVDRRTGIPVPLVAVHAADGEPLAAKDPRSLCGSETARVSSGRDLAPTWL